VDANLLILHPLPFIQLLPEFPESLFVGPLLGLLYARTELGGADPVEVPVLGKGLLDGGEDAGPFSACLQYREALALHIPQEVVLGLEVSGRGFPIAHVPGTHEKAELVQPAEVDRQLFFDATS
jgi:hypothetical protein